MPYMALIGVALDALKQNSEQAEHYADSEAAIHQERLRNKSAIYQGSRSTPDYSAALRRAPEHQGNSGLGAAIQALGAVAGSAGGDSGTGMGASYDNAIDHATQSGSYNLDPGILSKGLGASSGENASPIDIPSASIGLGDDLMDDKWKRSIRL